MFFFEGSNTEIGIQHGETLRDDIADTKEWYLDQWWQDTEENITTQVMGFRQAIKKHAPHLAEEIEGIAQGSNQPVDMIYAINSRTELRPRAGILECTSVGIHKGFSGTGGVLLAQNWDWWNTFRGKTHLVRIHPDNAPRMATVIEPGMLSKFGMNEAGVGVCLNFLDTEQVNPHGLPVHILLRLILESDSLDAAYHHVLKPLPRAASANYLIADAKDHIATFEATPDHIFTLVEDGLMNADLYPRDAEGTKFVSHANSYNGLGQRCHRQNLFNYMIGEKGPGITPDQLKPIFRHPAVQGPVRPGQDIETIHTIIMDLDKGSRELSDGSLSTNYIQYEF